MLIFRNEIGGNVAGIRSILGYELRLLRSLALAYFNSRFYKMHKQNQANSNIHILEFCTCQLHVYHLYTWMSDVQFGKTKCKLLQ